MKTEKKDWQTPEVIDLDVKNTEGGPIPSTVEFTLGLPLTHVS